MCSRRIHRQCAWVVFYPDKTGEYAHLVKYDKHGRQKDKKIIHPGNAYRITMAGVKVMPLKEKDPDPVRRFVRELDLPLNRIHRLSPGQSWRWPYEDLSNTHTLGDKKVKFVVLENNQLHVLASSEASYKDVKETYQEMFPPHAPPPQKKELVTPTPILTTKDQCNRAGLFLWRKIPSIVLKYLLLYSKSISKQLIWLKKVPDNT